MAIQKLKIYGDLEKISLIGLRIGATMAALVCSKIGKNENIVLWDPVINGTDYLEELLVTQKKRINNLPQKTQNYENDNSSEILGFPLTPRLQSMIEKVNLFEIQSPLAKRALIIVNNNKPIYSQFHHHLNELGVDCQYQHISTVYTSLTMDKTSFPFEIIQHIISWINKVFV